MGELAGVGLVRPEMKTACWLEGYTIMEKHMEIPGWVASLLCYIAARVALVNSGDE
jgi:hypothetical protein